MKRTRATLDVRPIPVPVTAKHPPPPIGAGILPDHEFTAGLIAPAGSGKTTLIANLLDFFAGYFHVITIFSPTLNSDEKWDYVRERPLLAENKDLLKFLEKKNRLEDTIVGKKAVVTKQTKFDPRIPETHFMTDYDETTLKTMMDEQLDMISAIKAMGATKHLGNRWLIIFDDLVGSKLFSGRKDNPFKVLNANRRHHSASILMVSQAYKEM